MVRKIFQSGDILNAEDVNEIALPRLDGEDFIGRGAKVTDANMDDDPVYLKAKFYAWYDRFRVSLNSGRLINISPGVIQNGGTRISFLASTFTVPANFTGFIYIGTTSGDPTVAVRSATVLPPNCIPLAKVVTNSTTVLEITDIRDSIAIALPPAIPDAVPTGTLIFSFLPDFAPVPTGYIELLSTVQNISRTVYSTLFSLFGTYYGAGDGSTTFGIPAIDDLFFKSKAGSESVGSIVGSNEISLFLVNIPPHSHAILPANHTHGISQTGHSHGISQTGHSHGVNDPGHSHSLNGGYSYDTNAGEGSDGDGSAYLPVSNSTAIAGTGISVGSANANISVNSANANISVSSADHGITTTQATGEGTPVNYKPRSIVVRVFLKY